MDGKFSFEKGWKQIRQKDTKAVKQKLMETLSIRNRTSWGDRLKGRIEPKVSEYNQINAIFAEYGITDVWGK